MWLFAPKGFVSVVAYDPSKDRNSKSEFRNIAKQAGTHLLVRARVEADLDMLKVIVPSVKIEADPAADYAYRCVVTRKQFKKFLASSVDDITYGSHFKEAHRDMAPPAKGRYEAMMGIWSKMAALQDLPPYGGSSYYGGSSGYYTSSSFASPTKPAKSFAKPAKPSFAKPEPVARGYETMEAFLKDYTSEDVQKDFLNGYGPKTGYSAGDRVIGHFGQGTVIDVLDRKSTSGAEIIRVEFTATNGKNTITSNFSSNYVVPATIAGSDKAGEEVPRTLTQVYKHLSQSATGQFPVELLAGIDTEALELTIKVGELLEEGHLWSMSLLNEAYEETLWDTADEKELREMASQGPVPERMVSRVNRLLEEDSEN